MSRLDSFIRRLEAQRQCLAAAVALIGDTPGPVFELGLGNGRTYDHLRELLPDREIFVFDRQVAAHVDCIPDSDHMIVGDFSDTLPDIGARLSTPAVMAHADIGSGNAQVDRGVARFVARALAPLMADRAIVVVDQPFEEPDWQALDLPDGVGAGRYFLYRLTRR